MADKNFYQEHARSVINSNKESLTGLLFASDIVIDDEAFRTAVSDFEELIQKIDLLKDQITDMLNTLHTGMDTPAGRKFMSSCEGCLLTPIEQQKIVISHIAEALSISVEKYSDVFEGYERLQTTLNKIDPV